MNYVAYYRVSTQKQSLGIEAQKTVVSNYLSKIEGANLIGEYSEKESGKHDNRPELEKAIAECKRANAKLIIAKIDRLSRNVGFIFSLRDSGVKFQAVDLPSFNTLTLAIFSALAQQERELCSQRTKAALAELKSRGVKLGRPNAKFTDEQRAKAAAANKHKSLTHPNNVKAVSMIRLLLKETRSLTKIANRLNEDGFQTMKGSKFRPQHISNFIKRYNLLQA